MAFVAKSPRPCRGLERASKDGVSEIENHEYKLFRWAEIVVTGPTAGMELDLSAWVVSYPWSEAEDDLVVV